ncbi:hypothetical protein [Nonomuraea indica]|uniref:hypothetical protein n=1 Tax=Nonomuraea indica TaxID=1581193 RepID=UPI000C7DF35E|nr:hypothetical protein [Nonomuraea indica]
MTEDSTERMPGTVRVAGFLVIVQLAFGLFGVAIIMPGIVAALGDPGLLVLLLQPVLVVALLALLVFRWSSRRKWVRWCAVAFEAVALGLHLTTAAVEGEFGWRTLIHLGAVLPLAIVVGLCVPAAARWFGR